ncbi:MAG TPA: hypothetical protein VJ732_07480 [Bryobacteraceae bacterium]|nr:hypothetical protein [Bryobacteraceae bacterium]
MTKRSLSCEERRSFLTRFQAGAAALAALAAGGAAKAQVKRGPAARFEPERHAQDDWMDQIPGKHRMVMDTTTADGLGDGVRWVRNFLLANRNDYGLRDQDMALILVARHFSTSYGFNNEMWAKYGASLAEGAHLAVAKEPPKANPSAAAMASLSGEGVRFAVCGLAARRLAGMIASAAGGNADAILTELSANLVTNARLVPAGIVAVSRAQERGYTLVTA